LRITLPDAPALNAIESPVEPDVIVPPVIVHVCVAPDAGTDAVWPDDPPHTVAGAVIVGGAGVVMMATTRVLCAVEPQPVSVAVTVSVTAPAWGAMNAIAFPVAEDVIVPPSLIVQVCVMPDPRSATHA
jgi:hypothetical protein